MAVGAAGSLLTVRMHHKATTATSSDAVNITEKATEIFNEMDLSTEEYSTSYITEEITENIRGNTESDSQETTEAVQTQDEITTETVKTEATETVTETTEASETTKKATESAKIESGGDKIPENTEEKTETK